VALSRTSGWKPVTSWRFGFSINAQAISVRQRIDVVKLGVNYKFDWGAIVAPPWCPMLRMTSRQRLDKIHPEARIGSTEG
jgi:hypothetical protein